MGDPYIANRVRIAPRFSVPFVGIEYRPGRVESPREFPLGRTPVHASTIVSWSNKVLPISYHRARIHIISTKCGYNRIHSGVIKASPT